MENFDVLEWSKKTNIMHTPSLQLKVHDAFQNSKAIVKLIKEEIYIRLWTVS